MGPRVLYAVLATSMAVTACASPAQQITTASQIKTDDDQFKPFRQYKTGAIRNQPFDRPGDANHEMELAAQIQRTGGARAIGLQVRITYSGDFVRTYQEARNAKADLLHIQKVVHQSSGCSKQYSGCSRIEFVVVDIPEAELRNAGNEGYPIKLFPKVGAGLQLTIPKSLIASLFTAVDAGEKQIAATQQKP